MAKGVAAPLPDPPNAWDTRIVEGEHWQEIQELLELTTRCAQADWNYRQLWTRMPKAWARLRELEVSVGRILRYYAVDGKSILTHPTILKLSKQGGFVRPEGVHRHPENQEET